MQLFNLASESLFRTILVKEDGLNQSFLIGVVCFKFKASFILVYFAKAPPTNALFALFVTGSIIIDG